MQTKARKSHRRGESHGWWVVFFGHGRAWTSLIMPVTLFHISSSPNPANCSFSSSSPRLFTNSDSWGVGCTLPWLWPELAVWMSRANGSDPLPECDVVGRRFDPGPSSCTISERAARALAKVGVDCRGATVTCTRGPSSSVGSPPPANLKCMSIHGGRCELRLGRAMWLVMCARHLLRLD